MGEQVVVEGGAALARRPAPEVLEALERGGLCYRYAIEHGKAHEEARDLVVDLVIRTVQSLDGAESLADEAIARAPASTMALALAYPDAAPRPAAPIVFDAVIVDDAPAVAPRALPEIVERPRPTLRLVEAPEAGPVPRPRRRGVRLPRVAYRTAEAVRRELEPDLLDSFDAVWRGLWPELGRATLAEAFAEWCEAHPAELLTIQCEAAEKRSQRLIREVDREYERAEREAIANDS